MQYGLASGSLTNAYKSYNGKWSECFLFNNCRIKDFLGELLKSMKKDKFFLSNKLEKKDKYFKKWFKTKYKLNLEILCN